MKNLKYILHSVAVLAVAALATACSSEEEFTDKTSGATKAVTLTAYLPNTRVGFDKDGYGYWHAGDTIGVYSAGEFYPFIITSGIGESSATFSGTITNEKGMGRCAFYPYGAEQYIGNDFLYCLPNSYVYTSVDRTFLPSSKNGNSFRMLMFGKIADNEVSFKHLGGVICLKIDKMPAESGTVMVTATDNMLWGDFWTSESQDTMVIKYSKSGGQSVKFTYSNAVKDDVGIFYLPVAPNSYNLTIQVYDGNKVSTTNVTAEVKRSDLKVVNVKTDYTDHSKTINEHNFIDLGLPSGLLWAETNIGAKTDADDGDYYAWGETSPKEGYCPNNYKYATSSSTVSDVELTKYNSTDVNVAGNLEASDDAAYVNWGSNCRMPTADDFSELEDSENCTWTWVSKINSAGKTINGYELTSKKNGNSIYLPASGYRYSVTTNTSDDKIRLYGQGYYWTSSFKWGNQAVYKMIKDQKSGWYGESSRMTRYHGRSVRPVAEP